MPLYSLHLDALAHAALEKALRPGMHAVDATAGNGYDTLFLARRVGAKGRVWAFDVQRAALEATRARLAGVEDAAPATLIHAGHEGLHQHIPEDSPINAAMFNLGYLPGSDKSITTNPEHVVAALRGLLRRAAPGAVFSVHAYTGHTRGDEELRALLDLTETLPYTEWNVLHTTTRNKALRPEHLFLLQRRI